MSPDSMRAAGIALLLALVLLVARDAATNVIVDARAVAHPYELDYGEGPILAQTLDLARGRGIYRPLGDTPPYRIANYPPVYHVVSAALAGITRDALLAGRLVSFASALLAAAILALLVRHAISPDAGPLARGLAAGLAALAFLRVSYTATWAPLMRVDMLAHFFSFAALLAFAAQSSARRKVLVAAPLLVLAALTRQSSIAAAATCLLVAWLAAPPLALRLGGTIALGAGASLGVLLAASGGWFWFHVVTANVNEFDWERAAAYLQDAVRSYPVEIAIALVALRPLLAGARSLDAGASPHAWARPLLGVYLLASLAVSATVGKVGSEVNYLIELMGAACACFAVAVADSLGAAARDRGAQVAALLLPALLLAEVAWLAPAAAPEWRDAGDPARREASARVLALIERTEGPVVSEDMTLLARAGKEIVFQPFEMTQLARQGIWKPTPFLESLERADFPLVVLLFDSGAPPPWELERFSPEMLAALHRGYAKAGRIGGYHLYQPKRAP